MSKELDIKAYREAKRFLLRNTPKEVTREVVESYLDPDSAIKVSTVNDLYYRILVSAQNANRKPKVIGESIGGVEKLASVLFGFCPSEVLAKYEGNPEGILETIIEKLRPNGEIGRTPRSIWPQYCQTILSAAEFFSQFESSKDFFDWAKHFPSDKRSFTALPLVLAAEIYGIGFPLACDFLKELGFDFGKPDVHIVYQFKALGLVKKNPSEYLVLKAIKRVAEHVGVCAYNVDKVFWPIGSGNFYNHKSIGTIGSMKKDFIKQWKTMA